MCVAGLAAASCQNDNLETVGNEAQVTLALDVEKAMATRASVENGADQLAYAVFNEDNQVVFDLKTVKDAFKSGSENISLTLVKGETYTVAFWAQNAACEAYTVTAADGGMSVEVDYAGVNNDETRDAFFGTETFTVEENTELSVHLKRPFAQVNLGVTEADWNAAIAAGINVTESKVVIKGVPTTLNLLDGSVEGDAVVAYDFAGVPSFATKAATQVKDFVVNGETYKLLSSSYVLADEAKSTSEAIEFTLSTDNGGVIVVEEGLNNVPLQRNWTTNVCGTVLTSEVAVEVTTDQGFFYTANVTNFAELKAALADRDVPEIVLASGSYEGILVHNTMKKVVRAATGATVTFKGVFGVAAPIEFHDINFVASAASNEPTGHQYLDRFQRKSVVPIYAAQAKFYNCNFTDVYNSHNVAAINYGAHKKGMMLDIDNCSFQGFAYAIYSRALVSVTNSTFDLFHNVYNPRTIFLYGLGDGNQGTVIFKGNTFTQPEGGKPAYCMEMSSANYNYKKIHYNVQGNTGFGVEGQMFLPRVGDGVCDFTGTTFEPLTETFEF